MASVRAHYENHLARYYSWISGGVDFNIAENRKFFRNHKIHPGRTGRAFDLGAGCGFQSIPLAELGYRVVAVDLSARLLGQLRENAPHLPIEAICDDLLNFSDYHRGSIDLVVCMGDTLTHLDNLATVRALLQKTYAALETGGRLILSFRNLSQALEGLDRFIAVKSNETTIFTCFLEYEKDSVKVHDIIYEKINHRWALQKSFYRKLRISPDWTRSGLKKIGFTVEHFDERKGLIFIIARKT